MISFCTWFERKELIKMCSFHISRQSTRKKKQFELKLFVLFYFTQNHLPHFTGPLFFQRCYCNSCRGKNCKKKIYVCFSKCNRCKRTMKMTCIVEIYEHQGCAFKLVYLLIVNGITYAMKHICKTFH